jgi:anti-anti-sigma factor
VQWLKMINSLRFIKGCNVIFTNFAIQKTNKYQNNAMKTTIEVKDGQLVAFFEGRLDTAASVQVEKDVKPLYDNTEYDIVLDCEGLKYISSSGLRIFLNILKTTKPKGHRVFIRSINDELRTVFSMTGFTNLFEFI